MRELATGGSSLSRRFRVRDPVLLRHVRGAAACLPRILLGSCPTAARLTAQDAQTFSPDPHVRISSSRAPRHVTEKYADCAQGRRARPHASRSAHRAGGGAPARPMRPAVGDDNDTFLRSALLTTLALLWGPARKNGVRIRTRISSNLREPRGALRAKRTAPPNVRSWLEEFIPSLGIESPAVQRCSLQIRRFKSRGGSTDVPRGLGRTSHAADTSVRLGRESVSDA